MSACGLSEDDPIMKKTLTLAGIAVLCLLAKGCATPGLTGQERADVIVRGMGYDMEQTNDDIDDILMLRPIGHLTIWDLQ